MFSLANFARTGCLMFLIAMLGGAPSAPAQELPDDDVNIPDGLEVQTRGPVHEAYAQPNDLKPVPGEVVPKEPPPPVPEEPPEFRPEGNNIEWIPGYWAWDPERTDYLWVSGTYRDVPEGRRWVPGYWANTDNGWQWVPGFWASARQEEVPYTPEPPEPLNNDPNLPAPDEDSTWLPGYWHYNQSRFVWRPGYWAPMYEDRVWVTPRYIWTPTGYLFCDGYWDYPYHDRGLLFAPVYFNRPLWHTAGWYYRPWYTVGLGLFYDHCFYRPGGFHFYFGNYYGGNFWGLGYRPWYTRYPWDCGFAYHNWYRHRHHGDRNWYGRQRQLYADRHDGRGQRPPRNFDEQRRFAKEGRFAKDRDLRAVAPVQQAKLVNDNVNIVKTSAQERQKLDRQIARNQETLQARKRLERADAVGPKGVGPKGVGPKGAKVRESKSFRLPFKDDEDLALTRRDKDGRDPKRTGSLKDGSLKDRKDGPDRPGADRVGADRPGGPKGKTGVATRPSGKKGPPPVVLNPNGPNTKPRVLPRANRDDGPKGKGGQPKVAQPKVVQPKVGQPKVGQPKVGQPAPRIGDAGRTQAPRVISPRDSDGPRVNPPRVTPQPKTTPAPKARVNDRPLPRIIESPSRPSTPRIDPPTRPSTPRFEPRNEPRIQPRTAPIPRFDTPAPRIQSPAPRINTPSIPRSSPAPRFNPAPRSSPAPRFNPAPRPAPRAAPRSAPRGRVSVPSSGPQFSAAPRSSAPRASAAQRSAPRARATPSRSTPRGKRR